MIKKLSIITVTYNLIKNNRRETFLQAIESVHNQTYRNFEHIVIDGFSSDGTQELLFELKQNNKITHYISEPDSGIYDAMNKGASLATGDYIGFLNSDDYYLDHDIFQTIASVADGECYIYGGIKLLDEHTDTDIGIGRPILKRFLTKIPFGHQSFFMPVQDLKKMGGFDTQFKILADYDLILRYLLTGAKGKKIETSFVAFRMGGLSSENEKGKLEKQRVWTKNYGEANYGQYIDRKILPLRILSKIFMAYPKARKNVYYEVFRNLRKFGF